MPQTEKRYLGVDWGEKRIGLALGDSTVRLASPFKTVNSLKELLAVLNEENIDEVVIGRPVKMSGEKLNLTKEYLEFLGNLNKLIDLPVIEIDERLTSKQGDSLPGGKKIKANRDEIAAMLILQTHLDGLS